MRAAAKRRAPKALLVWEFGRGLGHVNRLAIIGEKLSKLGVEVEFRLRDPDTSTIVGIDRCRALSTPQWKEPDPSRYSKEQLHLQATRNLGQVLGYAGFHDRNEVTRILSEWEEMIAVSKPDLVIADFAPSVVLVSRGRIPVLMVGEGYCVPPQASDVFHPFHDWTDIALFDDSGLLENVNHALTRIGRPKLSCFAQTMQADVNLACTLNPLDPLKHVRNERAIGPVFRKIPDIGAYPGERIFVYLHAPAFANGSVLQMLQCLPLPTTIFVPGLSSEIRELLVKAGHEVLSQMARLDEILPRCQAVINQCGAGVVSLAMLAGRPQLALTTHIESVLTASALKRTGTGLHAELANTDLAQLTYLTRHLASNRDMMRRCEVVAREIRNDHPKPAVDVIVRHCVEFLFNA